LAIEILHNNERRAFMLSDLVHRADVRVIETRDRPRLALKALSHLPILRQLFWQELESHLAVQLWIVSSEYFSHAAPAQKTHDLEPSSYYVADGKALRLGTLEHGLAQGAARLLVVPQKLLNVCAQFVIRTDAGQVR